MSDPVRASASAASTPQEALRVELERLIEDLRETCDIYGTIVAVEDREVKQRVQIVRVIIEKLERVLRAALASKTSGLREPTSIHQERAAHFTRASGDLSSVPVIHDAETRRDRQSFKDACMRDENGQNCCCPYCCSYCWHDYLDTKSHDEEG